MTETTKNTGEKLSVTSTKTLTLKRGGVDSASNGQQATKAKNRTE